MHLIKLPLSPIKPHIVTNKDLIIITNPNSEDGAEAFQSLLVSAKGITEKTHMYEVHKCRHRRKIYSIIFLFS
jgi:hypothetical protein